MSWNDYSSNLADALKNFEFDPRILDAIKLAKDHMIFTCGNGGSSAIASHLAADLCKGANKDYNSSNLRYRAVCLSDATPQLTAIANDIGYDQVFKQQLITLARPNDLLIAISSSGNSPNITSAVEYANDAGIITIGLSGFDGGRLKKIAQYSGHIDTKLYEIAEDVHHAFCHYIVKSIRGD